MNKDIRIGNYDDKENLFGIAYSVNGYSCLSENKSEYWYTSYLFEITFVKIKKDSTEGKT